MWSPMGGIPSRGTRRIPGIKSPKSFRFQGTRPAKRDWVRGKLMEASYYALLAQLVEQATLNRQVIGSRLIGGSPEAVSSMRRIAAPIDDTISGGGQIT